MTKRHSRSRRGKNSPGWMWMLLGLTLGLIVAGYVFVSDVRAPRSTTTPQQAGTPESQPAEVKPAVAASKPEAQAPASAKPPPRAETSTARASRTQTPDAQAPAARTSTTQAPAAQTAATVPTTTQTATARFQFYENLPQSEVVVPEPAAATTATTTATTAARQTSARAASPAAIEPGTYMLQVGSFRTPADADRRKASIALLGYESQVQQATVNGDVVHRVLVGPIPDPAALDVARRRFHDQNFDTLVLNAAK